MSEKQPESKHQVRIHIDRKPYQSPNLTTGQVLYVLGKVPAGHELYREVQGNEEDQLIHNGDEAVQLKEDEHFYSAEHHKKEFTVIVNGRQKVVTTRKLTFAAIVALAFDNPPTGDNVVFTVTYRRGPAQGPRITSHPNYCEEVDRVKERCVGFEATRSRRAQGGNAWLLLPSLSCAVSLA